MPVIRVGDWQIGVGDVVFDVREAVERQERFLSQPYTARFETTMAVHPRFWRWLLTGSVYSTHGKRKRRTGKRRL